MRKTIIYGLIFFIGLACALILTHGSLRAQGTASESDIMTKLDDIAKTQAELMTAVNSIKEELQIIKIRVTQQQ